MGRQKRDSAKFQFLGRKIEMYRPTGGQTAALGLIGSGQTEQRKKEGLYRFFRIIENLTVSPASWTWMDDQLVEGNAEVEDFGKLLSSVIQHEWDAETSEDAGE